MKLYVKNRRRFITSSVISILFLITVMTSIAGFYTVFAREVRLNTHFVSVEVKSEDTLWNIANRYRGEESTYSYLNKIVRLNKIDSSIIKCGEYIIVPIKKNPQ